MPKKKRTTRSKQSARRTAVGPSMTAEVQLRQQFVHWYDRHADGDDGHSPTDAVDQMMSVLFALARQAGRGHSLARPDVDTLDALLDLVDADDELAPMMAALVDILQHYLQFLGETGAWAGTDEEFDACFDILEEAESDAPGILSMLLGALDEVVEPPATTQLRALDTLVPVAGVTGLLDWIGRSHAITSTGALRLGDIETVAALIDVSVRGKRNASRSFDDLDDLFDVSDDMGVPGPNPAPVPDANAPGTVREVSTMWDVEGLSTWWQVLVALEVIETTATTVRPGPAAASWRFGDEPERLAIRARFVLLYVNFWFGLEADGGGMMAPVVLIHLFAQLAAAVSPGVLPQFGSAAIADVLNESNERASVDLAELEPAAFRALDLGAFDFGRIGSVRATIVMRHLQTARLVELTEVADGTARWSVPEALRSVVAESLQGIAADLMHDSRGTQTDAIADSGMPVNVHAPGTQLQVKIALADSRPAIWRRIVVDAHATLGQLHQTIQRSFDWYDAHLHRFAVDGWYSSGLAFGPAVEEDAFGASADVIDENDVGIGSLLRTVGDELFYVYDFGDDWRHLVRLEKVTPVAEAKSPTPRCVDGRGAAPLEDSGGSWGWAELGKAAADSKHPDHADALEQLDLPPGATFDPAAFDLDAVNERLRRSFR